MNENSLYGSRYGYACKSMNLIHALPSCQKSKIEIRNGTINEQVSCKTCVRWDVMSNQMLSSTQPPKNHPKSKLKDHHQTCTYGYATKINYQT